MMPTKAIVQMAEALQLVTIAEGIETQEQAGYLVALGVTRGQGFLYHRPLEEAALILELQKSNSGAPV